MLTVGCAIICGIMNNTSPKPRILVAGGTGYIGSHTSVELIQSGYSVTIIDDLSNSNASVVDGIAGITGTRPDFVKGDCTDMAVVDKVFEDYPDIKAVINFAAFKAVGESVQRPLDYYRNNLNIILNLLDSMTRHGVRGFVFSSSCTVYGQPDENPVTENSPVKKALSPYGNTKQIAEEIIEDAVTSGAAIDAVILRYFNPVGAHPSSLIGEMPNGVPLNLVPFLTQAAMGIRKELSVFGNDYETPDGTCIRDYIDITDLAKAHVYAVDRILDGKMETPVEIFNIGTGNGVSVRQLIDTFESATGVKVPHKIAPRRAGDITKVWADPARANEVLGWHATVPLAETLLNAWKWQIALRERGIQ